MIGSLYGLSHSWSSAAAPRRFSNLLVSRTNSSFFKLHILPRYAHHFRAVTFDALHSHSKFNAFLRLLLRLPNLHTALLPQSGFEDLMTEEDDYFKTPTWESLGDSRTTLAQFLGRLVKLDFQFVYWHHIQCIAGAASSLQVLHLRDHIINPEPEILVDILQLLPNLRELSMGCIDDDSFDDVVIGLQGRPPPLVKLIGVVNQDAGALFRFAHLFHNTLTQLTLTTPYKLRGTRNPIEISLPRLRSLHVRGEAESFDFFRRLSVEQLPALTGITVHGRGLVDIDMHEIVEFCGDFKRAGRPLRTIRIADTHSYLDSSALELIHQELSHPETHIAAAPSDPFLAQAFLDPRALCREAELGRPIDSYRIRPAVEQTVDFINDWLAQARNMNDDGAYARLAVVLQRAEVERVIKSV